MIAHRTSSAFNISDLNIAKLQKLSTAEDIRLFSSGELQQSESEEDRDDFRFGLPFRVLAAIIAKIFNVQLCMISFLKNEHSYLNENSYYAMESMNDFDPRDILITKDTFSDHRFHKDMLVIEPPHIRFYAELPIVVNKVHVATLSLLDQEKRLAFGLIEQKSLLQVAIMIANVYAQGLKFEGGSADTTVIEQPADTSLNMHDVGATTTIHASSHLRDQRKSTPRPKVGATKEEFREGLECNLLQVLHSAKCMLGTAAGNIRKIQWVLENSILSEYHRHVSHPYTITLCLFLIYEHLLKYWIKMTNDISFRVCAEKFSVKNPPSHPPPSQCYIVKKKQQNNDGRNVVDAERDRELTTSPSALSSSISTSSTTSPRIKTRDKPPVNAPISRNVSGEKAVVNVPLSRNSSSENALPALGLAKQLSPRSQEATDVPVRPSQSSGALPALNDASPRATSGKSLKISSSVTTLPLITSPRCMTKVPLQLSPRAAVPQEINSGRERTLSTSSQAEEESVNSRRFHEQIEGLKHRLPRTQSQMDSSSSSSAQTTFESKESSAKLNNSPTSTFAANGGTFDMSEQFEMTCPAGGHEWEATKESANRARRSRANTDVDMDIEKDVQLVGYVVISIVASTIDLKSHLAPLSGIALDIGRINNVLHHIDGHIWATECGPESANSLYEIWIPCTLVAPKFEFETVDKTNNLSVSAIARMAMELNEKIHEGVKSNTPISVQTCSGSGTNETSRSGSIGSHGSRSTSLALTPSRSNSEIVGIAVGGDEQSLSNSSERKGAGSMMLVNPNILPPDVVSSAKAASPPPAGQKKDVVKVLVIEDSLIVQKLFVKLLKGLNCEVKLAKNGKIGLDMLKTNDFDITFMDFLMPVQDGLTTMRLFKEWIIEGRNHDREFYKEAYVPNSGRNEQMMLIGISDIATEEEFLKAQQLDMHFFCKKPVSNALISSIIEACRVCATLPDTLNRVNISAEKAVEKTKVSFFSWAKGKLFEQH